MKRTLILLSTTLAGVAHAQTVLPLAYPHNEHAICHEPSKLWYQPPAVQQSCKTIRDREKFDYQIYVNNATKVDITHQDADGKIVHDSGRRNVYNQALVKGGVWDSGFTAQAWLKRFTPNYFGNSSHPEWEDGSIDSCDEYVYKKYYGPNRYLDLLNGIFARRGYLSAVATILNGIPAYGTAKAVVPVPNNYPRDYDGYPIRDWHEYWNGGLLPIMTPQQTGTQIRNPFYGMTELVKIRGGQLRDSQWEYDLQWAYLASWQTPTVTYPSNGEFGWANTMRTHADITSLSASEADAIAERVDAMRKARASAMQGFQRCVTEAWIEKSLSSGIVDYKSSSQYREYVEAQAWDYGATDPVPYYESMLQTELLDSGKYQTTLAKVIAADVNGTDVYAQMARTRTGTMLRTLSTKNSTAVASSVYDTQTAAKSGAGNCALSADFDRVRELLVDEYRRGAAGCMSTNKRCDFVPKLFVSDTIDRLTRAVADADVAKNYCQMAVGAFDGGSSPVPPSVRSRVSDLENYMRAEVAEVQELLEGLPRRSTLPRSIGDRVDGGNVWGDPESFGAGYAYSGEWGINSVRDFESGTFVGESCQLGGRAKGHLDAFITAFTIRKELVDVTLAATTAQATEASSFFANVEIAEQVIYTDAMTDIPATHESEDKHGWEIPIVKTTLLAGPIPVSLEVSVGFDYGYKLELDFTQTNTCDNPGTGAAPALKLGGAITPFAGANAAVSAYVDLFIIGAGLKGKLTLVEARLPYKTSIAVSRHTSDGKYYVHASSSLKLVLTELSGGLYFILKAVGITVLEHEIFSWPGIRQEVTLWDASTQFPIQGFELVN